MVAGGVCRTNGRSRCRKPSGGLPLPKLSDPHGNHRFESPTLDSRDLEARRRAKTEGRRAPASATGRGSPAAFVRLRFAGSQRQALPRPTCRD